MFLDFNYQTVVFLLCPLAIIKFRVEEVQPAFCTLYTQYQRQDSYTGRVQLLTISVPRANKSSNLGPSAFQIKISPRRTSMSNHDVETSVHTHCFECKRTASRSRSFSSSLHKPLLTGPSSLSHRFLQSSYRQMSTRRYDGEAWVPLLFLPGNVAAGRRQSFTSPRLATAERQDISQL